jgi:hypothetical protein|tara:strand:- start:550 stop:798 length:249 start_codon:yes stop_codon:yes gene_type:complete
MRNFKLSIDLSDIYLELHDLDLREYNKPFMLKFIEAENPDDACHNLLERLITEILDEDDAIEVRIFCRKLRKYMRIDRIQML